MIYDGALRDTTNFCSTRYLEINSCNIQQSREKAHTVIREAGRVDYHILYVAQGECLCLYEGSETLMKKGEFVIYPPGVKQRYSFMEGTAVTTMWIHFSGTGVEELFEELGLRGGIFRAALRAEAEHYFRKIISANSLGTTTRKVAARGYLFNLLSALAAEESDKNSAAYSGAVSQMIEYINLNWQKNISVRELAERVNLSESRTSHLFKEAVDKSIHRYIGDIKISAAKELLTNTELSVAEISSFVGFDDPLYFSRAFKSSVGVSPTEYRGN